MDLESFRHSLTDGAPPEGVEGALQALWYAGRADWDRAHEIVQSRNDRANCWVHAHLHRVEGDLANAGYWYRRAGRDIARGDLQAEWDDIVRSLLRG